MRRGYEVVRVGRRRPDVSWGDEAALQAAVDGAELVVNLAGKSVGCRHGDANRAEIYRSRVATTEALHRAVVAADRPPRVWLNASTATIYRHAVDRPQAEDDGGSARASPSTWLAAGSARSSPATCRRPGAWRCGWPSSSATGRR